jgi:predicted permease
MIMALFPLVFLIGMGYVFKRTGFLQEAFWANSEKLNYFILFPALLFSNLSSVKLDLGSMLMLYMALIVVIILISVLLWLLKFHLHIPVHRFGVYIQSQIRFNTYIGLSLMGLMFGATGMQLFTMMIAVAIPLVNIVSVWSLTQSTQGQLRFTLMSIVKNPLIAACLLGIAFNCSGLLMPEGISQLLKLLASSSLPLGLISVGAALQFSQLKPDFGRVMMNSVSRLLAVPILTYFVAQ